MLQRLNIKSFAWLAGLTATAVAGAMFIISGAQAQSKDPIKIGFGQSLTGFLSPNGKQALLGAEIWRDRVNKSGGLLGRPVHSPDRVIAQVDVLLAAARLRRDLRQQSPRGIVQEIGRRAADGSLGFHE